MCSRKTLETVTAGFDTGISQFGDTEKLSAFIIGGKSFFDDNANFTGGVFVEKHGGLLGRDREISAQSYGFSSGQYGVGEFEPGLGGSAVTEISAVKGVDPARWSIRRVPGGRVIHA